MTDIRASLLDVYRARNEEIRRRMNDYDTEVFRPAVNDIQAKCAATGHKPGSYKMNGKGRNWIECDLCDAKLEEWHGPTP